MADPIVSSCNPIMLVGGAQVSRIDLNITLKEAPSFVAVDGGADHLLTASITPAAVFGDFDSISDAARAAFAGRMHETPDQNLTDMEKSLAAIEAPLILGLGFLGGRLDHILATLNVLVRHEGRPLILVDGDDVVFAARPQMELNLGAGTRVALLPMGAATVSTRGLRWDLSDGALAPDGLVSSSNAAAVDTITIDVAGPVIVTLGRAGLPAAIAAVRAG